MDLGDIEVFVVVGEEKKVMQAAKKVADRKLADFTEIKRIRDDMFMAAVIDYEDLEEIRQIFEEAAERLIGFREEFDAYFDSI